MLLVAAAPAWHPVSCKVLHACMFKHCDWCVALRQLAHTSDLHLPCSACFACAVWVLCPMLGHACAALCVMRSLCVERGKMDLHGSCQRQLLKCVLPAVGGSVFCVSVLCTVELPGQGVVGKVKPRVAAVLVVSR